MKVKNIFLLLLFFICWSCQKEISVNPEEAPAPSGSLFIESIPIKSKIYINGKNTGRLTPDIVKWLKEGSYKITLKLENYKDTNITKLIKENESLDMLVDFNSNPTMRGSILFKTTPDKADIIFMDSLLTEKTPFQLNNLLPGIYKVKYEKTGYWGDSLLVTVKSSKTIEAQIKMVDSTLWVVYNSKNSGLPSDWINCVVMDKQSNIWIGTNDNGLVKFSNNKFTVYNIKNSSIPDNCVKRIDFDTDGNLWISTYGLVKFDGINFITIYKSNGGLPSDDVTALEFDSLGRMWVGTYDKGVAMFDGNQWIQWNTGNSALPSNCINAVRYYNGQVYVGTPFGLSRYKGKLLNMIIQTHADPIMISPSQNVKAIEKNSNFLFVGLCEQTKNGGNVPGGTAILNQFDWWRFFTYVPGKDVTCFAFDSDYIWIGTQDNGFAKATNFSVKKTFKRYNSPLTTNWVSSICVDNNHNKWIATFGGGLVKYKGD